MGDRGSWGADPRASRCRAVVQAVVSKREMRRLLPDDSPRTVVSRDRARRRVVVLLVRRGRARALAVHARAPTSRRAMAFEFASTNLVFELGIVIGAPAGLGVRASGEFVGGPLMIVLLVVALPSLPEAALVDEARARRRRAGSARWRATPRWTCRRPGEGSWWQRLRTPTASRRPPTTSSWTGPPSARDIVGRAADRGRARGVGAATRSGRACSSTDHPTAGEALGAADRAGGRDAQLRLLGRQRAARRGALERRHQLRRRARRSSSPT